MCTQGETAHLNRTSCLTMTARILSNLAELIVFARAAHTASDDMRTCSPDTLTSASRTTRTSASGNETSPEGTSQRDSHAVPLSAPMHARVGGVRDSPRRDPPIDGVSPLARIALG